MFEARLENGMTFKLIIEALKDLVNEGNIDCTKEEITLQAMDAAHVALVSMGLNAAAFAHYRCDRTVTLGVSSENLSKILKMMTKDDQLILKAEDEGDSLTIMFENAKNENIADFGECCVRGGRENHGAVYYVCVCVFVDCCLVYPQK